MDSYYDIWRNAYNLLDESNYTPSAFLLALIDANKKNILTDTQVEEYLKFFHQYHTNYPEFKYDLLFIRIRKLLITDDFELSRDYLFKIHKFLFADIEDYAGELRIYSISKKEKCLDLNTVYYSSPSLIIPNLDYDFLVEKQKDYNNMQPLEVANSMTRFISNIWSCHPFYDGNTRTISIFLQKYLNYLGIKFDHNYFYQNASYFRNALVRNNSSTVIGLKMTSEYLNRFFEGLFNNNSLILKEEDTYISRNLF